MTNERLQYLLSNYQQEACTDEEYAELDNWFHSLNYTDIDFSQWMKEMGGADQMSSLLLEDFSNRYVEAEEIKINWWKRISVAAAAVAAITLGVWLYNISNTPRHPELVSGPPLANDVAPGKNTATLTLANGQTINLSEAKTGVVIDEDKLTYNDGAEIPDQVRHEGEVIQLTASTPRGGTYEIILPDSTHVWLNAASSLKFPSAFTGKERIVELTGEAYFEVAKDKTKRFLVRSAGQEVTVLGTHFNINSYEATVRTTLLEGSVQVTPLQQPDKKTVIKPGQQAVVTKNLLEILPVDVEVATAWKNGNFLFRKERLESIMKRMAYWYDVEVIYLYDKRDLIYSGVIGRKRNLSSILSILESAGNVKFKIEGRKVYVFD